MLKSLLDVNPNITQLSLELSLQKLVTCYKNILNNVKLYEQQFMEELTDHSIKHEDSLHRITVAMYTHKVALANLDNYIKIHYPKTHENKIKPLWLVEDVEIKKKRGRPRKL